MKKLSFLLLGLSMVNLVSCGGGGGGLSGSPEPPPQPVSVNIIETSATLDVGDTFQFHASVNNTTNTTITWTVNDVAGGNSTFGTMSVDGLYTTPASVPNPNTVTAKATSNADKTKSATATITINPRFTISPTSATVAVGRTQQFTANLAVDVWQVNGILWGSNTVGTITSSGLYTAPASVPNPDTVAVKAIKLGDASKTATATVMIAPPGTPTISPTSVTVPAGATQQFTADIAVTWEVGGAVDSDPSTWGTIDSTGLYTAPVSPPWTGKVNITAKSQSDPTKSANAVATVVFSNATMNGHYAFRYRSVDKGNPITDDPAHFWAVGSFVADGKGAISGGSIDLNEVNRAQTSAPFTAAFTGTYSVNADGRASGTFSVQTPGGAASVPLRWVMISNTAARMIGFDDMGSGWGNIDLQDPAAFSAGLSGTYVFSYDGLDNALVPHAAAGMFNANAGVISSGLGDFNDQLGVRQSISFDGGYTSIDPSTGRGTWNYTDSSTGYKWSFAYYLLNSSTFVFSSTDQAFGTLGVAVQQDTSSAFSSNSLSGDSIFISSGYDVVNSVGVAAAWAGLLIADGNGKFSDGVVDNNVNGSVGANMPYHGAYSIGQNGHGTAIIANTTSVATNSLGLYMTAANSAFWVSLDPIWVATGQFNPQASETYNAATFRSSFAFTLRASYVSPADDMAGQMTSDGAGNLTGMADVNAAGTLEPDTSFTGTYTVSANGRGEVVVSVGPATLHYAMYLQSGRTAFLVPIDPGAQATFGLAYRQF